MGSLRGSSIVVSMISVLVLCTPLSAHAQDQVGEVRGIKIWYWPAQEELRHPRGCIELPEVIEGLNCYPDTLLDWLGGFHLEIYVYAPSVPTYCPYGSHGCYDEPSVIDIQGGTGATKGLTVHEVAHAIQELLKYGHELCDRNLRLLYLDRLEEEFGGVFGIPDDLDWVGYENYGQLPEVPPGFVSKYSTINQGEDFAESCRYYVIGADDFLRNAETQAEEGNLRLQKKYLTLYRDLFLERSFTDALPEEKGFLTLTAVEREPRNGRLDHGELFSLRVEMTLFEELGDADQVRCVPAHPEDDSVIVLRSSAPANGLHKWQTYTFDNVGEYQVKPGLDHDLNFEFTVQCRMANGQLWTLGSESIPLNVEGYLWAFRSPENLTHCGDEGVALVRVSSTLKEMETIPLPAEMCGLDCTYYQEYDSRRDLFWFFSFAAYGTMAWFDREAPGTYRSAPIDPQNLLLDAEEVNEVFYNPVDGAFWLLCDCEKFLRIALTGDGRIERRLIDLTDGGNIELEQCPRFSADPRSGRVWIAADDAVVRYDRAGTREVAFEGIERIEQIAAMPDGGCLVHQDFGNAFVKIGPDGALDRTVSYNVGLDGSSALMSQPYDCAVWFRSAEQQRLVRAADGGNAARVWGDADGWPVAGFAYGSMFLVSQHYVEEGNYRAENADRYTPDGAVYRGDLSLAECSIFGFQPAGDVIPRIAVWDGQTYMPPGGRYDYPGTTVAGPGAAGSVKELAMENTGGGALGVTRIALEGAGATHFEIVAPYPNQVASGARAAFSVRFVPKSAGSKTATLAIATNDPTMPRYTLTVSGTAVAPEINVTKDGRGIVSGGACDLGAVWVGAYSQWAVFTVQNSGSSPLTLGGCTMGPEGADQFLFGPPASARIEPGASTFFIVVFAPTGTGAKSTVVTLRNNDPDESVYTIRITATAVMPPDINVKQGANVVPAGGRYDFGNTRVNSQGYVEFSIENKGGAALHLDSWAITGEQAEQFSVAWTPHQNIEPGNSSLMSILFVPASEGIKRATVTIRSNDPDETAYVISLTGTGFIPQDINVQKGGVDVPSPAGAFAFGDLRLGRVSAAAAFVLQNTGKQNLAVGVPALSGAGANQFRLLPGAAPNIAPGGSAGFTVDFRPTLEGVQTATVSIANNDPDRSESPYTFTVTGRGVVPDINLRCGAQGLPSGKGVYNYGSVTLGSPRSAVFTIEDTGTYKLVLTPNAPVGAQDAATFQVMSYTAGTLLPGGNTLMVIRFAPSAAGAKSATVTILSDDPDENPYTFTVTGTGVK